MSQILAKLSHLDESKVTYTNGFHVNTALTGTSSIWIDENSSQRDYSNIFKCMQPVVDEKALIPS